MIDTLNKLTPETVRQLRESHEEDFVLPDLRVTPTEFYNWVGSEDFPVEYKRDTNQIVVLAPGNAIHQSLEGAMKFWFTHIANELNARQGSVSYSGATQVGKVWPSLPVSTYANSIAGVALKNGTKVPDAALVSHDIKRRYPLVVVEIGFSETLDKLFDDATRLISGSSGKIDAVILVKVFEANRHLKDEFPWGIEQHDIASLRELDESDSLAPQILFYYETRKLKLIGDLNAEIYWYPKTRKSKPTKPIYAFRNDPQNTPNGSFTTSKHFGIEIGGNSFDLPVAELEREFSHGIAKERNGRISKLIQKAGV